MIDNNANKWTSQLTPEQRHQRLIAIFAHAVSRHLRLVASSQNGDLCLPKHLDNSEPFDLAIPTETSVTG